MRLFVGIEISPLVAAAASGLMELLRERAARLAPRSRITWIAAERLHLTVRFIGEIDDSRVAGIVDALRPSMGIDRFEVAVAGVGVFPPKGPPRVIWAGLSSGRDQLASVELAVSDRLAAAGVEREGRPFDPHLTLARVRDGRGLRAQALLEGLDGTVLGTTAVEAITLFESQLSPQGPHYRAIHRTPLA